MENATETVLALLWDARDGCMVTLRPPEEEEGEDIDGEEGGPGPP